MRKIQQCKKTWKFWYTEQYISLFVFNFAYRKVQNFMVQLNEISFEEQRQFIIGLVGGVCFVLVFVYIIFQCICCKKRPVNSPSNGSVEGPNRKRRPPQLRPITRTNNNEGCYEIEYSNNARFLANHRRSAPNFSKNTKLVKNHRLQNGPTAASYALHRALPAPPSTTGNNNNNNNSSYSESLTRESSTSELYASVDKNPSTDDATSNNNPVSTVTSLKTTFVDHHRLRQQPTTSSSAVTSRCQSHFYAKICDDHHVYSKIWTSPDPGITNSGDTYDNVNLADDNDFDPFYSRVNEENNNNNNNSNPINNTVVGHQHLLQKNTVLSHHAYEYPQFTPKQSNNNSLIIDGKESIVTDPFYSKIGSEDPYSSIKSEEHYSRVDREDSLSVDDVEDIVDGPGPSTSGKTKNYDDDLYFRYARPGPSTTRQPIVRRFSDGDEYTIVRKGSAGVYRIPARLVPPPVPDKQFSSRDGATAYITHSDEEIPFVEERSRKEPSYRYITVRESLDVLRERMEQQLRPLASNYVAVSDPSLHYYSTISEHSYEVVPSRIGPVANRQPLFDDTLYIDQDDVRSMISDIHADVSAGQDLNSTVHSDEMTMKGSHVTLVQVDAVLSCDKPQSSADISASLNSEPISLSNHFPNENYDNIDDSSPRTSSYSNSYPKQHSNSVESKKRFTDYRYHPPNRPRFVNNNESAGRLVETADGNGPLGDTVLLCRHETSCESSRRADADAEYPTTFCFCHAQKNSKKSPSSSEKNSLKGRLNNKRERDHHF